MTPNETASNTIVIGQVALAKLIDAIEQAHCTGDNSRLDAVDHLVLGISALLTRTDANVTIESARGVSSFRDCDDPSDIGDLLDSGGGPLRVEFLDEKEGA